MTPLKSAFTPIFLLLICLLVPISFAASETSPQVDIVKLDPGIKSTLGSNEMLYGLVHYESDVPLRFQAIAMFRKALGTSPQRYMGKDAEVAGEGVGA